jgi:hypothetical protein
LQAIVALQTLAIMSIKLDSITKRHVTLVRFKIKLGKPNAETHPWAIMSKQRVNRLRFHAR